MLPTFLVIGAQKAATTTLHDLLGQRPDVWMAPAKETNFFLEEGAWRLGTEWYESHFDGGRRAAQRGEVSPGYTMFPFYRGVPERASSVVPDARLVYVVRHPVARMVSSWAQGVTEGVERADLVEAMLLRANYLLPSFYGLQAEQWLRAYPRERLLVVRSEDLEADEGGVLDRIATHLGLEPGWRPDAPATRRNASAGKRIARRPQRRLADALGRLGHEGLAVRLGPNGPLRRLSRTLRDDDLTLPAAVEAALLECFRADLARLRAIVGPDLDLWGLA